MENLIFYEMSWTLSKHCFDYKLTQKPIDDILRKGIQILESECFVWSFRVVIDVSNFWYAFLHINATYEAYLLFCYLNRLLEFGTWFRFVSF